MFIDMVYPVEAEMPIAINIYSAANDIITITRGSTNIKIKTDATGKGQAWLPLGTYTFTSSIGKDPDNLTDNFSKDNVGISSETTDVYLMPDGHILYWYGYISDNCENISPSNGWTIPSGWSYSTPTYNQNSIYLVDGSFTLSGIGTKTAISGISKSHMIAEQLEQHYNSRTLVALGPNKAFGSEAYEQLSDDLVIEHVVADAAAQGTYICNIRAGRDERATIYALWCE